MIGEVLFAAGQPAEALRSALEASRILEDLARADSNDRRRRASLAQIDSDLGDDEAGVARNPHTPLVERTAHWRAARSWYLKSQEIYRELREHGKLVGEDGANFESNARQLALCDAALAE